MRSWMYFIFMAACMAVTAVRSAPPALKPALRLPDSESSNSPKSVTWDQVHDVATFTNEVDMDELIFEFKEVKTQAKELLWKIISEGKRAGKVFSLVYAVTDLETILFPKLKLPREPTQQQRAQAQRQFEKAQRQFEQIVHDKKFHDHLSQLGNKCNSLDSGLSEMEPFFLSKEQLDNLTKEIGILNTESQKLLYNDKNNNKIQSFRTSAINLLKEWWKEPKAKSFTQHAAEQPMNFKSDAEFEKWLKGYEKREEKFAVWEKAIQTDVEGLREYLDKELKGVSGTGQS